MVGLSSNAKESLAKLYTAAGAEPAQASRKIEALEGTKMNRNEFEDELDSLTREVLSRVEDAKRKSFEDGVRAALQKHGLPESAADELLREKTLLARASAEAAEAAGAAGTEKTVISESDDAVSLKLELVNEKLAELDSALESIHESQRDLREAQKRVELVEAAASERLAELDDARSELAEQVDAVRVVARRVGEVAARLPGFEALGESGGSESEATSEVEVEAPEEQAALEEEAPSAPEPRKPAFRRATPKPARAKKKSKSR